MRRWEAYPGCWRTACRLTGRATVGAPLLLTLFVGVAQAQPAGGNSGTAGPLETVNEGNAAETASATSDAAELRAALSREMARMKADIATMKRFTARSENLLRIARTDPAEALRQRLPMSECRASALAPLCDHLTGLFAEEPEDTEPGPAIITGEDAE